jgi:NADPH:quinone reductase-like Zn-dependent oxidoreductase
MKRLRVLGVLVDSRASFEKLVEFLDKNPISPAIDRRFAFEELQAALRHMEAGAHFGKIVVEV